MTTQYFRLYELPWEGDPKSSKWFRRLLGAMLLMLVFVGILIPLLPTPKPTALETAVPERLARVMIENKPKPPPPPPKVVKEDKPKVTPEKKPIIQPKPVEHPREVAHQKAQKQLNKITDELADLREKMDLSPMMSARNLSGAVMADSHAERSMITSKVGAGSGGITSAPASHNFGGGAGSLVGHDTTTVTSNLQSTGLNSKPGSHTGANGKPGRSREEIETVFDKNKGAIYALYNRALRENPALQGKMVLEFTISPAGDVTMCRVVSTELNNKELEEKIIARVRLFHFDARKDVEAITTTKPIDFFPA
jgi:protein TonB